MHGETGKIPKKAINKTAKKERSLLFTLGIIALILVLIIAIVIVIMQTRINKKVDTGEYDSSNDGDLVLPYSLSIDNSQIVYLYFGLNNDDYLAGLLTNLKVKSDQIAEEAALEMLLEGPDKSKAELINLIPENTKLLYVDSVGDILYVAFDNNIMKKQNVGGVPNEDETIARRNRMLYSIVNTVTNIGNYSKVKILIDKKGTGVGVEPTCDEFGYVDLSDISGGNRFLPAISFDESRVLNARNTVTEILRHWENMEWVKFYNSYLAQRRTNEERPTLAEFESLMLENSVSITNWQIIEVASESTEDTSIVWVDLEYIRSDQSMLKRDGVPLQLRKENGLWKMPYVSCEKVFFPDNIDS